MTLINMIDPLTAHNLKVLAATGYAAQQEERAKAARQAAFDRAESLARMPKALREKAKRAERILNQR